MSTIGSETTEEGTPIQEFFVQRSVLITGATGFFGKILIDKLLRTCPKIGSLYLLVRPKKGKDMEARVEELFQDVVFERLKNEVPWFRQKIFGINGDCALPGLGISAEDRVTITKTVSVVFHGAATVRFDENLKIAVAINVSGTKEVLSLCRDMPGLKAAVHVSTAYANCNLKEIDEKFYEPGIAGENLIKMAECCDEDLMGKITPQVIGKWPNTYAFTKCAAEDVVLKLGKGLPLAMFRPAIVISTYKEPVPGWIDNIYGPIGVNAAAGAGLLRVMRADLKVNANLVPVDYAVSALIASAWDVAKYQYKEPPIYNFVTSCRNPLIWGDYHAYSLKFGQRTPFLAGIWYYTMTTTTSLPIFYIYHFLLHLIPGAILDSGLCITGRKPKLLKAYKKINKFLDVIAYFSTNEWKFYDHNVQKLWGTLSKKDQDIFHFNVETINWYTFFRDYIRGNKLYLAKEDLSTSYRARIKQQKLMFLHYLIKYGFLLLLAWICYRIIRLFI